MDLWYHLYLGHPLELPVAAAIVAGLFLLIRKTDPSRSRLLIAAASCLAGAPVHWVVVAPRTQRIVPPIVTYLLLLGLLLSAIGFASDARFALWLRALLTLIFAALFVLALLFWVGAIGPSIAI